MINFDYVTKEDMKYHNPNWPEIPDHPYKILKIEALDQEKEMHYLI